MTKKIALLIICFLLSFSFLNAQENIKVYYKKIAGENLKNSSVERIKLATESLKELEYELIINANLDTVCFQLVDKVFSDKFKKGALVHGGGNTNYFVKNKDSYTVLQIKEEFNKKYFRKYDFKDMNKWVITKETKKINNYLCYKATLLTEYNGVAGFDEKTLKTSWKKVSKTLTAWFCPEIPYSFGPDVFYGLPGLVFEGYDSIGYASFVLDKITYNKNKTKIKIPNLKILTEEESLKLFDESFKNLN